MMRKTLLLVALVGAGRLVAQDGDPLREAESVLDRVGGSRPAGLRAGTLAPAGLTKADVVGTWKGESVQGTSRITIDLVFKEDGTVSNVGSNGGVGRGTWSIDGDEVVIAWSTNGAKVRWPVADGEITRKGTTSRGQAFSVYLRKQ